MTNAVFLDASFWVVFRDDEELRQPLACRIVADLFRQKAPIVTTLPVICEVHAYFARNPSIRQTILLDFYENPVVTVEAISLEDQRDALKLLRMNDDKTYSLCDALSFVVMRRLNIRRALSFDKHFHQFGEFEVIPNQFP
jgi:predicted nucleic acid-binding protein